MQLNVDSQNFLAEYWQRKPALFRRGFADFADPIAAELLAGLACEDGVDSRIVESAADTASGWRVTHGPFTDYEAFGDSDWTLLVQAVNEWFPDVQALLSAFRFIPDWRLDDVMVSFACPNGGVGPHLDQYDVFIIQGEGSRRWRVGNKPSSAAQALAQQQTTTDLLQLAEPFDAVIDETLEAGDILYIPAGCPHEGIAITPSLAYSVGFRAPNQAELLAQLVDAALEHDNWQTRYSDDGPESFAGQPWQVSATALQSFKQLLHQAIDSDQTHALLLRALSQSKRPLAEPEMLVTEPLLAELIKRPGQLCKTPGARILAAADGKIYAAGQCYPLTTGTSPLAQQLGALTDGIALSELQQLCKDDDCLGLLSTLLNDGVLHLLIDEAGSTEGV